MAGEGKNLSPVAEVIGLIALVGGTAVGAWYLPEDLHYRATLVLLATGLLFSLLSLFYHVLSLATGEFMSGLPFVGLFFFLWFLIASRYALTAWRPADWQELAIGKAWDLLALVGIHLICELPGWFNKRPSNEE